MNLYISEEDALQTINRVKESNYNFTYDFTKHKIIIQDNNDLEAIHFRLPISLSTPGNLNQQDESYSHYVIILIQSGSSALGYFEGGEMLDHKVFKSYMVRKKQGKSQIKHLKTKGKSKAGSRVRLGNTVHFFENINERLQEYFHQNNIDRIALSCSKTLMPYLFNSKVACPFDKKDERIYKIPRHIHQPQFEVLLATHKYLSQGELIYAEEYQYLVLELTGQHPK